MSPVIWLSLTLRDVSPLKVTQASPPRRLVCGEPPFSGNARPLYHSTTIELLSLLILIKGFNPRLRALLPYEEVVISLMAVVARKFMQGRHAGKYF